VFENIIAQSAAVQVGADLKAGRLAPSMLFYGPFASGKGSTALELARALSCEKNAAWNCGCPSCQRHRNLVHSDILCMGKRPFSAEIAASRAAFLREPLVPSTTMLFIRSVRRLMARFSPVLWESEPKLSQFRSALESLEEALAEFEVLVSPGAAQAGSIDLSKTGKIGDSILKNALILEADGISDVIPIAQIRRASYWTRLAPSGKRKMLLIENAGQMRDEAKNSLLKLLEEPPETVTIVLTSEQRQSILPTLLSRLRPYRFLKRDREKEAEVIRRVFRDTAHHEVAEPGAAESGVSESGAAESSGGLGAYLESFLPASNESLLPIAAFFIASISRSAAVVFRKRSLEIPDELNILGMYCTPIAEAASLPKAAKAEEVCSVILEKSSGFEMVSFSRFLKYTVDLVSRALRNAGLQSSGIFFIDTWRKAAAESESAFSVYNQNPVLVLESLFYHLKTALSESG